MRLGLEYLKPGTGLHSSMADFDETPDHRAQLMRAWSADKALMAQAGLSLQATADNQMHATHLGMFNNVDYNKLMKHEHHDPQNQKIHKDGKLHKWIKRADANVILELITAELKTIVKQQAKAANQGQSEKKGKKKNKKKKHEKHNPHLSSDEDTAAIDSKITSSLKEYKNTTDEVLEKVEEYQRLIPSTYRQLKKVSSDAIDSIKTFQSENNFGKTFTEIGDVLFEFVTSPNSPLMKRYHKAYSYPLKHRFSDKAKIKIMRYGFLVHAIVDMICDFTYVNSKIIIIPGTANKDLNDHLKKLNTHYKEIIDLKGALHTKLKKEKGSGPYLPKHRQLKNLSEDFGEELDHAPSFKMGQPFEEY